MLRHVCRTSGRGGVTSRLTNFIGTSKTTSASVIPKYNLAIKPSSFSVSTFGIQNISSHNHSKRFLSSEPIIDEIDDAVALGKIHGKVPFKKLLASNRGEIATRIMRAASELGIPTVGIYAHEGKSKSFGSKREYGLFLKRYFHSQDYMNMILF